jgi:branched-chain amino acid transport system ATP-binding protein
MLEVRDLAVSYGDVRVLWDISLRVERGEIVTLVGANGAGKTTLLRAISRTVPIGAGAIVLEGVPIHTFPPQRIVAQGVAHVPEGRRLWAEMTVEDNLLLGAYQRRARARVRESLEEAYALFPRINERRSQIAGTLSGGEQQMVAIARGLMLRPEILMLDEPSLGLAPIVVLEMFEAIKKINRSGTTVLLVEQNVLQALQIATRGYVIETGRVVMSGSRDELLASDDIKKAYLGL